MRFSGRLDIAEWRRRHAAGDVPDAFPYGLDRMAEHGYVATNHPSPPSGPADRLLAKGLHRVGGYDWWETWRRRGQDGISLCWDERVGVPLALGTAGPVATGVIWLTDRRRTSAAHRRLAGESLRRAAAVWALSSAQLPVLRDRFGVRPDRLHHVLFGVDADFFRPEPVEPDPGLVVGVGNDADRDHPLLVRAVAAVRRANRGARLELVTRQPVALPPDLGTRHAHLGHRELRSVYLRAGVVAIALRPNLHVSGVTALLEAMACGRPVVVSDTAGMRDYVADGTTGLLVPPGDAAAMEHAIRRLLDDPELAAALGAAARRRVEERCSTATMAGRLAHILDGL